MILDDRNEFCDATSVALTAGASWQNVGDVIDRQATGNDPIDLGAGEPIYLVLAITTGVVAAGAGTITFRLVSDTSDNPPHISTSTVHWTSSALTTQASTPAAGVVAGTVVAKLSLPIEETYERYLGVQVLVSSNNTSAGAINAFLTNQPDAWRAHVDATN